ncbi:hypothetical protein LJR022_010117 [Paraburkholderia hospita]|uniref:hypothetical protein n=1 Tax=Paraburkholderia hospita TaxID=169430 RepID=UPI003ECCABA0
MLQPTNKPQPESHGDSSKSSGAAAPDTWRETLKQLAWLAGAAVLFIDDLNRKVAQWLVDHPGFVEGIERFFRGLQGVPRKAWEQAAMQGWYIANVAPFESWAWAVEGGQALDNRMIRYLDDARDELEARTLALYPERAAILRVAFDLHRAENYIASIPLLLTQVDGICAQHLSKSYFFAKTKRFQTSVKDLIEQSGDDLTSAFLSAFLLHTPLLATIDEAAKAGKTNGPNRHGILHGSVEHLDYGSKVNGYKAFSLLCFVAFCFDLPSVKRLSSEKLASD